VKGRGDYEGANPEDPNELHRKKKFFSCHQLRVWKPISDNAKKDRDSSRQWEKSWNWRICWRSHGGDERQNASLKGVLPKVLRVRTLTEQVLAASLTLLELSRSAQKRQKVKMFLAKFMNISRSIRSCWSKKGGQFYTPRAVVSFWSKCSNLMKAAYFDPCCVQVECLFKARNS